MATQKKSAKKSSTRTAKTSSRTKAFKETQDMQSTGLPDGTRSTAALAATADTSSATAMKENDWRKRFFIPLIIVLLAVLAYVGMQQLVVATVNGVPVSRITLLKEMESQIGEQVLDSLITRQLILQEAKKQNIAVTDEEIDQEIEKLKEQFSASGQDFDELLKLQGMTMERVREEIRLQKIMAAQLKSHQNNLQHLQKRLQHPGEKLRQQAQTLDQLENHFIRVMQFYMHNKREKIVYYAKVLETLSPLKILQRGFSITRDKKTGKVIQHCNDVAIGESIITKLIDGEIESVVCSK